MTELYGIFLLVGILLFAAIAGYSWHQKNKLMSDKSSDSADYVKPLFEELQEQKKTQQQRIQQSSIHPNSDVADSDNEIKEDVLSEKVWLKQSYLEADDLVKPQDGVAKPMADVTENKSEQTSNQGQQGSQPHSEKMVDQDASKSLEQERVAPSFGSVSASPQTADSPKVQDHRSTRTPGIRTELVVKVKNPVFIEQKKLLALFRTHDYKFKRKVHIYGLNELTDMWRDVEHELPTARFIELGISIQLADRNGALGKKELHDFQQMIFNFAEEYDAPFEFSMPVDEAEKQAQYLDELGRKFDSMVVLNIVPRNRDGFRLADIESCARDLMMVTDKQGIFIKTKGQKQSMVVLYRLACTDGSSYFGINASSTTVVHDLVIYMNVPITPNPELVFEEMIQDANSLATWLDGKVVDRANKVMTDNAYGRLLNEIITINEGMKKSGLVAGDEVTKKLF